jgi:hypothetical protein
MTVLSRWIAALASIKSSWSTARHIPKATLSPFCVDCLEKILCDTPALLANFPLLFCGCVWHCGSFADIYEQFPGHSFPPLQPLQLQEHVNCTAAEVLTEETWEMYRRERVFKCSNGCRLLLAPYHGITKSDTSKSDTSSACSSCKVARYCSPECQAADWHSHISACASYKWA